MPNEIHGLKNDQEFVETVHKLYKVYKFDSVVETGTNDGTGSTSVFAQLPCDLITIECNPELAKAASWLYKDNPKVHVFNGLTCRPEWAYAPEILKARLALNPPEVIRDVTAEEAYDFYIKELSNADANQTLLKDMTDNSERQLVFLDSAGGMGWEEYQVFLALKWRFRKVLLLDDINHCKHFLTVKDLETKGCKVHKSKSGRWCWVESF